MIIRRTQDIPGGGLGTGRSATEGASAILNLSTRAAEYSLDGSRLALVSAWQGRQEVTLDGRRILVDDDTWLAVPATSASIRVRGAQDVQALTILFRVGMPEEVLRALLSDDDRLLEDGEVSTAAAVPFAPHLQPHDRSVTPVLLFIRRHCEMGLEDPLWYEEQLAFLLERMLMRHRQIIARARGIPVRRAATQREILRRISLATDFIHSSFDRPLMLSDMASAAFLSRHHFLRLFKHIHDVTPHEYLQRKRTMVAARMLRNSELGVEEICSSGGLRFTLDALPRHAPLPRRDSAGMPSGERHPGIHGNFHGSGSRNGGSLTVWSVFDESNWSRLVGRPICSR